MSLLIGIDVGTSALKAIVVRAEGGEVVAKASREYPIHALRSGWAEQDVGDFDKAALETLAELGSVLGDAKRDVCGIGLTGQMHSAVLLDEADRVTRRAILWCDTRTTEECREIASKLGHDGLLRTVKNLALEGFTLPKLLWIRRHEPEIFARVRRVIMPKDWVGYRLTGVVGTDVSDASGTLCFDPVRRAWSREMLDAVGLSASFFPEALESATVLGPLSAEAAEKTGLPPGIPVIRGAADNAAGAVGLGIVREGRGMASIGTSGVVLAHTEEVRVDDAMRLHSFCSAVPGKAYLMGVMLSAGGSLRWFRDAIARRPYDEITRSAAASPRGARGLVFLPYLMGERTPHNDAAARGAFIGLSATTGDAELARAVLEGISLGLGDSLAIMRSLEPPPPLTEIRLTGGGARSAVWRQMLADVFGIEVVITSSTEGPAFGAAILAGAAVGAYRSVEEGADATVRVVERTTPERAGVAFYRELAATYGALYGDLRARFAELRRYENWPAAGSEP